MKTYQKYIFGRIAAPMLLITLGIVGIAWLSKSLKFIDLIVNKGLSVTTFLYLTALTLPSLFWVVLPVGLFLAITYSYNKLSGDSEIIVLKAAGVTNFDILKPALYFSLICMTISYSIALYFLPASYREFKDMQSFIRNNYATLLLQEGVFSSPARGLTVYIKEKDDMDIFHNMVIHDSRSKDKEVTIIAQKGFLESTSEEGPMFILKNGSHQERNKKTGQIAILYFERYNLQLDPFKETLSIYRKREAKERFMDELLFPKEKTNEREYREYMSEFNNRITWPLYNVLLALIAVFPFIKGNFDRRGNVAGIAVSSVISLLTVITALSIKSLAQKNINMAIVMYAILILETGIFYYYLTNSFYKNKEGKWKILPQIN